MARSSSALRPSSSNVITGETPEPLPGSGTRGAANSLLREGAERLSNPGVRNALPRDHTPKIGALEGGFKAAITQGQGLVSIDAVGGHQSTMVPSPRTAWFAA